jgi:hypothetical protein
VARTRMLKPELRTSEKVASWPREVRYFWVLLWGYLDDYGKGRDNPMLVKADCFPLDPDVTPEVIDGWLWLFSDAGVLVRYEVEGVRYMVAVNWLEHQKPQHPTASKCPDQSEGIALQNDSRNVPESLTPGFSLVQLSSEGGQRSDGANRPPLFCSIHPKGSNGKRCGGCADARRVRDEWDEAQRNKPIGLGKRPRKGDGHPCTDDGNGWCPACGEKVA